MYLFCGSTFYVKGITFFCTACHWRKLPSGWNDTGRSDRQHKECLSDCLQGVQQGYSDTLELDEEDLARVHVRCSSDEGKVFLQIRQEQTQKEIDITNTDSLLDMTDFLPGRITFTMVNENGRNVDFELEWRETPDLPARRQRSEKEIYH